MKFTYFENHVIISSLLKIKSHLTYLFKFDLNSKLIFVFFKCLALIGKKSGAGLLVEEPGEPAEPAEPGEPAEPAEPAEFEPAEFEPAEPGDIEGPRKLLV